ncbi:MAG: nuclear transport factor 2 family protein [Acidimicrobiia bacterium]|nr:nuclear transport factor 2 family protein [Acidimicrobiia bacterium]
MDHDTLVARLEITDLLTRYANAVDTRDWESYRSVFTADAHIDYSSAGGAVGDLDTVTAWLRDTMSMFEMTQHLISNVDVTLGDETATVRAMFYNPMRFKGGDQFFCGGYYNHDLVRTGERWWSRRLVEDACWFDGLPAPAAPAT